MIASAGAMFTLNFPPGASGPSPPAVRVARKL